MTDTDNSSTTDNQEKPAAQIRPGFKGKPIPSEMFDAIAGDNVKQVMKLIEYHGLDINAPERSSGNSMLMLAAGAGAGYIVEELLAQGADVNQRSFSDQTPLHQAALQGQPEMLRILIEHKADIEAVDFNGMTALHHAMIPMNSVDDARECAHVLIVNGADPTEVLANEELAAHFPDSIKDLQELLKHRSNRRPGL